MRCCMRGVQAPDWLLRRSRLWFKMPHKCLCRGGRGRELIGAGLSLGSIAVALHGPGQIVVS